MDILSKIENICMRYSERVALIIKGEKITYQLLKKKTEQWETELLKIGVREGDKIIVYVNDILEFISIFLAIWHNSGIVIPIDPSTTEQDMTKIIQTSNCDFVLVSKQLYREREEAHCVKEISPNIYILCIEKKKEEVCQDCVLFLYTSGTTGVPKCVWFSKRSFSKNIIYLSERLGIQEKDICYTPISLFLPSAMNTILWPALISGCTVVIEQTFVPAKISKIIQQYNVSIFYAVPYFYEKYVQFGPTDKHHIWTDVKLCLVSSALLLPQLFDYFWEQTGQMLHSIYCSSEAGVITCSTFNDKEKLRSSVGSPMPEVIIQLENMDNSGSGDIFVCSKLSAGGYYTSTEGFKVFETWIPTGDKGYWSNEKILSVLGRSDNILNIAGFLVCPSEIEGILMIHPEIDECYVYGDYQYNEVKIVAQVVTKSIISKKDIIKFCSDKLPYYKVPRELVYVDHVRRGRYGKINRRRDDSI